jgi:hypothetical protein
MTSKKDVLLQEEVTMSQEKQGPHRQRLEREGWDMDSSWSFQKRAALPMS